ncbi:MAG: NnrU family protein [Pseudomonadota bacterium]
MTEFLVAFVVFLLAHVLPTRPPMRGRLVARLGERGFQVVYSAVSLGLLAWLIVAAVDAPYVELWAPALWHMHLAIALMPVAFVLMAVGVAVPNPLSISLVAEPEGWSRSGLLRVVRHPLLVGLALWGGLHTLANGALVPVLLFGGLALFALAGIPLVERRRRREHGAERDAELAGRTTGYRDTGRQALAGAVGLVAMTLLLVYHLQLFGADPLAWLGV